MLVRLSDVQKRYKDFKLNCSLEVEEGTIVGFIGPNGAGKSTTFKTILGLVEPHSGEIELLDKPVNRLTIKDREDIGVVMAESFFSNFFTIKDIVAVLKATYSKFNQDEFLKKCEYYKLPLDKKLKEFSTGMKAKIKVLTAMSYGARLLILDEPTSGLDAMTRNEILDELRDYMEVEGRAVIISSHISSDLESLWDKLYFIQNGQVVYNEDTVTILYDYSILKVDDVMYEKLDKSHIISTKKETFGYKLLTNQTQFYV
jgi:ABC-2 type transport system ATP-binding protein